MIKLVLPSSLVALVPEAERPDRRSARSLALDAESWRDVVVEVRARFPVLADRVLTESDSVAAGFALVVNDEIVPVQQAAMEVHDSDEISLLPVIAGG